MASESARAPGEPWRLHSVNALTSRAFRIGADPSLAGTCWRDARRHVREARKADPELVAIMQRDRTHKATIFRVALAMLLAARYPKLVVVSMREFEHSREWEDDPYAAKLVAWLGACIQLRV